MAIVVMHALFYFYPCCLYALYSNCDNLLGNSSINCSSDSQPAYLYANETIQSNAVKLFETLSNVTNGSYCKEMLDKFLCSVIFPPFNQSDDSIQTLCPESCQNYVSDGICAIHVEGMVDLLMTHNMNNIVNSLNSCSSPFLQPSNNKSLECYNLTGNVANLVLFFYYHMYSYYQLCINAY